jgi:hypothetical protein
MKNIHLLLILVAVFLSAACEAQELSKNFIEISAGAGIPIGAFASKENNIKSGLAMPGPVVSVEYTHFFKSRLGFCVGLKRSVFPLDVDAWTNSNPYATSDPWRVLVVYGGLASRKRIRANTILSTKAAIGVGTSKYPEATIPAYSSTGPVVINFTSSTGSGFAFIVGASLKRIVSEKIHLALSLDYLSTAPKFLVTQTVYSSQSSAVYTSHYTQNMQALTAGLTLCYNFVPKN